MSEFIERVAAAAYEAMMKRMAAHGMTPAAMAWADENQACKADWLAATKAGMAAMREPTAEMVLAAVYTHPRGVKLGGCIPTARWQAMIDAALAEVGE